MTRKRVASPDIFRVIAQKGRPLLSSWLVCVNVFDVLLDGTLTHVNTQFQEFPANTLSTPEPIILRHLPDQCDGFRSYLGLVRMSL